MAETNKKQSAPYASFPTFINFFNKLQETGIPSRIDPSVFGNASGSVSYSVIAALKSLKLILEDGSPTKTFTEFVNATEDDRKVLMRGILRTGYPSLFNGQIDLTTATAGQFDEHLREEYEAKGSTVDKAASFFIAAAGFADEPISAHLKNRKPVASSSSSRKSTKQRKKDASPEGDAQQTPRAKAPESKPLQYQLIDLMTEPDFPDNIKGPIWELVQYLTLRQSKKPSDAAKSESDT